MEWNALTLDEYADFQIKCGARLSQVAGQWWNQVGPFFYRPLNPLIKFAPGKHPYPLGAFLGGVQHAVADPGCANSYMNFFVYEDLQSYGLDQLNHRRRRETRRSLENFKAHLISDLEEFVECAHPLYLEFYRRTSYQYRKERVERRGFEKWANAVFSQKKIQVLGVYRGRRLVAVDLSFRLGEVIFEDVFFSNDASLELHVTNFVVHTLREAAVGTDAVWLCRGATTTKPSLDDAKARRGCRLIALPAHYQSNPLALMLLRCFRKKQYRRLLGSRAPERRCDSIRIPAGSIRISA